MTAMGEHNKVGRLALREEGEWWNAYYALTDTMEGAIPLGSVRIAAAKANPQVKERFIALMREVVSGIIEETAGIRPTWGGIESAPEHERAGSA